MSPDTALDVNVDAPPAMFKITLATKLTPPGQGSVSIAPLGTSCGGNCYTYPAGTSVTVTASPIGTSDFQAWLGECKGFTTGCTFNVTKDGTVTGWFRPRLNYMFVSSKKYPLSTLGSGGTLKTADDACDALAQAASLTGATGTYRAWLAMTPTSPAAGRFVNKRGFIRVDGKVFGDLPTDFGGPGNATYTAQTKNYYPPRLDENGTDLGGDPDTKVAVGQLDSGEPWNTCTNWTSTASTAMAGNLTDGVGTWAGDFDSVPCNASARIYCFEILHNVAVVPPAPTTHMVFVTGGKYTPSTLAAADTLCKNEAQAAGISTWNLFKALVSTTTQSAFARLGTLGAGPFVRPDGVEIVANPNDLGTGTLTAPIDVTAAKTYLPGGVWTGGGATPNATAGSAQDACTNWAATAGNGVTGSASTTKPKFYNSTNTSGCSTAQRLYCVQP